ncbi:MAG: DNA polymerase domain-containing protein, partial [Nitrososphaerales archaeon]
LDVYPGRAGEMVAWLKKDDGGAVRLTDSWRNAVYVSSSPEGLEQLAEWAEHQYAVFSCEYVNRRVNVFEYAKRPVLKLTLRNADHSERLAKELEMLDVKSPLHIFNADLMPAQTYFFEKELFPLARVRAEQAGASIRWKPLDSVMSEDYRIPPLRKASIRVRVDASGRIPKFSDPIEMITVTSGETVTEIVEGDERAKMLSLVDVVRELDPDIVFVEQGDGFTTHYLAERAWMNGISDKIVLSRDREPLRRLASRGTSYMAYGKVLHTPTSHKLYGRINLDAENYFVFSECGLDGLFEIARLCRMPLHKGSRASIGKCLSSLQAYVAFKDELLIPWKPDRAEIPKTARTLLAGDRGGFIYEPKVGLHEGVGEIDFTSLFPFIMTEHNISAETVLCWCCPDSGTRVPDVGYHICEKRDGVIPRSLEPILTKRVDYKLKKKNEKDPELKRIYASRVDALKGILVCSFGYLSYRNAKFGLIDCHISVCAYARQILLETARIAEMRGFEVVHGIVDSLWVKKPGATEEDFEELRREIQAAIGLPLAFEGVYRWVAFLPSRMHEDVPVLNRYFGVFEDGSMKVRGIELRRRDGIKVVTDCQSELLRLLAQGKTLDEARRFVPEAVQAVRGFADRIRGGGVPVADLAILNSLSKNHDQYNSGLVQVSAIRQLAEEGLELMAGQSVSYVITDYRSKVQSERVRPIELLDSSTKYDADRYVELLLRGASAILQPFGVDEEALRDAVAVQAGSQTRLIPTGSGYGTTDEGTRSEALSRGQGHVTIAEKRN